MPRIPHYTQNNISLNLNKNIPSDLKRENKQ